MKLLLVEDQSNVVEMFAKLPKKYSDIDQITTIKNEEEFEEIFKKDIKEFDVVIMDLMLDTKIPISAGKASTKVTFSGFTLMKKIHDKHPLINIVVLTQFNHEQTILACFKTGARCFMSKHLINMDEFVENLKAVSRGDLCIDPSFSQSCKNKILAYNDPYLTTLTDDELDLLELVFSRATTDEIMELLEFQMKASIYNKISKMVKKTGFSKRTDLATYAISIGMEPVISLSPTCGKGS